MMTTTLTTAKTWDDVRDLVNDQAKLNSDFYVSPDKLRMAEDGTLVAIDVDGKAREMGFTDTGLQQLATKTGIPSKFAFKLAEFDKSLLAANFNTMIERTMDPNKNLLVRATEKATGTCVRALLSDRYGILDNHEYVAAIADAFARTGLDRKLKIEQMSISDKSFHMRLTDEGGRFDAMQRAKHFQAENNLGKMSFKGADGVKHDFLFPMLHLSNSEIGSASIKLEGGVYRVVCTNGLVAPMNGDFDSQYRRRHFGFSQGDLNKYVVEKAESILRSANTFANRFADTQNEIVEKPEEVLEKLMMKHRVTKTNEKSVRDELGMTVATASAKPITTYDLINAFTATARDMKDQDARVDFERIAATLVGRN